MTLRAELPVQRKSMFNTLGVSLGWGIVVVSAQQLLAPARLRPGAQADGSGAPACSCS